MERFVPTYQGKPFLSIEAAAGRIVFLRIMVVIINHDKEE